MFSRLRIATAFAFTVALTNLAFTPAHAQKPVLTQNIDEKGRVPYQDTESVESANCSSNIICRINFKAVPTGYRLVITYVSASYTGGGSTAVATTAALSGGVPLPGTTTANLPHVAFLVAIPAGANTFIVNSPVTYYVESGGVPSVSVQNVTYVPGFEGPEASISGYLVALN